MNVCVSPYTIAYVLEWKSKSLSAHADMSIGRKYRSYFLICYLCARKNNLSILFCILLQNKENNIHIVIMITNIYIFYLSKLIEEKYGRFLESEFQ